MITCKYCLEIWEKQTNKQYYKLSKVSFIKQRVYYHIIRHRVSKVSAFVFTYDAHKF